MAASRARLERTEPFQEVGAEVYLLAAERGGRATVGFRPS
jgi:hypothetical protein